MVAYRAGSATDIAYVGLLLERWMDEEWFIESSGDPSAEDEWTWSEALGDRKTAVLQQHWNSWITDDDVRFIAES